MADSWYIIMLQMTSSILDVLDEDEKKWIPLAADFVSVFHVTYFLKCSMTVKAARNDLEYIRSMEDIKFQLIASTVQESLLKHTWYLSDKLFMLSIFDDDVTDKEKLSLCQKLLKADSELQPCKIYPKSELSDLVTIRSWDIFLILGFKVIVNLKNFFSDLGSPKCVVYGTKNYFSILTPLTPFFQFKS